LKRYKVFLTKMVFLKRYKVFRRKTCVPSFSTGQVRKLVSLPGIPSLPLFTPFRRKGAGKGYQVRKLVSIPFHPFSKKRGREGIPGMDTTKFGAKYNLSYFLSVRKKEI